MNDKTRGSDQIKMTCSELPSLTQEELAQVAGGYSGLSFYYIFPRGIPANPWLFQQNPAVNPAAQLGALDQLTRFG
jgi:hypothetical protein